MSVRRISKILAWLVLALIYGAYVLLLAPLSIWLLFNAQTWTGRGLAVMGLILATLPATLVAWLRAKARRATLKRFNAVLGVILIGIASIILLTTPSGSPPPDSPIQQRFTQPIQFNRWALSNIVPEAEQVNLGFQVMPYLDSIFTSDQARRVAVPTFQIYRDLESDPNFHELGSAMGWVYAELTGDPFDVGHYYLYIPRQHGNGPLPAIVFLHGSVGNFKGYVWLWSKIAEKLGMVIISPSYGFGNWDRAGSLTTIERALDDAATQVAIDPARVYLAGLSNGGLGVSRAAFADPDRYRGLIFISPVIDINIVDGKTFLDQWRDRPVLVIAGEADERIPYDYVTKRITLLKAAGVDVTQSAYPGEDHFLFFSQADNVLNDISQWLTDANR
jgi:predicted esterase